MYVLGAGTVRTNGNSGQFSNRWALRRVKLTLSGVLNSARIASTQER